MPSAILATKWWRIVEVPIYRVLGQANQRAERVEQGSALLLEVAQLLLKNAEVNPPL